MTRRVPPPSREYSDDAPADTVPTIRVHLTGGVVEWTSPVYMRGVWAVVRSYGIFAAGPFGVVHVPAGGFAFEADRDECITAVDGLVERLGDRFAWRMPFGRTMTPLRSYLLVMACLDVAPVRVGATIV